MLKEISIAVIVKSGAELVLDVTLDCFMDNDGIGSFEFWGAKCYDKGNDFLCIEGVEINKVKYIFNGKTYVCRKVTNQIKEALDAYLAKNKDEIEEMLFAE